MAGPLDSVASFEARVREIGLGDLWGKFQEKGLTTYANFGCASSHVPGAPDDTPFITKVCKPIAGDNEARYPPLRRLYFEAFSYMTSEVKTRIEATDEDKPRTMTIEEVNARRERIVPKLRGLDLDGEQ